MNKDEKSALEARIVALEARIEELERCKHDSHTLGDEALSQIVAVVKRDIAVLLMPPSQETQVE